MVSLPSGNGVGLDPQAPAIKVNGVLMPLDKAVAQLLEMNMSRRCNAISMCDARKLEREKGWHIIDGIMGAINFIGTQEEMTGFTVAIKHIEPPWQIGVSSRRRVVVAAGRM